MRVVEAQFTPNPNAIKFVISGSFPDGSHAFRSTFEAQKDRIAKPIFSLGKISSVFYTSNFLTVSKEPEGDWQELKPAIMNILTTL